MARGPLKQCKHPGCGKVAGLNGYCTRHQAQVNVVNKSYEKDNKVKGMYTHRWQKASKGYLSNHPWCEDCITKGLHTIATEVHHKIKHRGDSTLFWDVNNWMGLCHSCHSTRTRHGE